MISSQKYFQSKNSSTNFVLEWVLLSYQPFYGGLVGENDPFHKKASHENTIIFNKRFHPKN